MRLTQQTDTCGNIAHMMSGKQMFFFLTQKFEEKVEKYADSLQMDAAETDNFVN